MSRRVLRTGPVFLLIFFLCATFAYASSSWQVGMIILTDIQKSNLEVGMRLYERFSAQFTTKNLSAIESQAVRNRMLQTALVEAERLAFESTKKNDGVTVSIPYPKPQNNSVGDTIPITWSLLPVPKSLEQSVREGEGIVLEHLVHMHSLDQIIIVSLMSMDRFTRLVLQEFTAHTTVLRTMFDRIAQPQDVSQMILEAMVASASTFNRTAVGALHFTSSALGVKILLNETTPVVPEVILFVEPGNYSVKATARGHEPLFKTIQVVQNTISFVDLPMKKLVSGPLLIQSPQGEASLTILPDFMTTLPHLLLEQELPLLYRAEKTGFITIDSQLMDRQSVLELRFTPDWMTMENTLNRQKDAFYASLGRTLLLVGLSVAMESVSRAASTTIDRSAWQPAVLASAGLMGVSLTDTIFRLFAYYQKTQYISR